MDAEGQNLEGKVWYRFLKVVYIACYILALALVAFLANTEKPVKVVSSFILCDNGKAYGIKESGFQGRHEGYLGRQRPGCQKGQKGSKKGSQKGHPESCEKGHEKAS